MAVGRIDIYTHYLMISQMDGWLKPLVFRFCDSLVQFGFKRQGKKVQKIKKCVFAASTMDRKELRLNISMKDSFMRYLAEMGYSLNRFTIVDHSHQQPVKVELPLKGDKSPRDYQENILDYIVNDDEPNKVVTIQTGRGKTFIALTAASRIGYRTFICVLGRFMDKWIEDVESTYNLEPGDLLVIDSKKALLNAIQLGQEGKLICKVIICTTTTLQNYIKTYEAQQYIGKPTLLDPSGMYAALGCGFRIIDEIHMFFHVNFKIDLYSNIYKTLGLSATLESDDPFMNRMYNIAYPKSKRYRGLEYKKYIASTALYYQLNLPTKLRWIGPQKTYSHTLFEESILRSVKSTKAYLELIATVVKNSYMNRRKDGHRMLIFASTKEMCRVIAEHLKGLYPTLKISRYVAEDDYEVLMDSDISVSTLGSSGTGVDIPGLTTVLMTSAVGSRQANSQAVGRLRELLQWPDVTPEFIYLVCQDIPKHEEYHQRKFDNFKDKVLSQRSAFSSFKI